MCAWQVDTNQCQVDTGEMKVHAFLSAAADQCIPLHQWTDVVLIGSLLLWGRHGAVGILEQGRGSSSLILSRQRGVCSRVPPARH